MKYIAYVRTDFGTKFGLPRQSGLVPDLKGCIVFEPEYRIVEALRGLEDYSHLWLLWDFSEAHRETWSPTVRPPRLGGNARMGVFATRSPFRPNPIGLSCVELDHIDYTAENGPLIWVRGIDMMDGTPLFDIKPYLPFADCRPEAKEGFAAQTKLQPTLEVVVSEELYDIFPSPKLDTLKRVLSQDPRPRYQNDQTRVYGIEFCGKNVHFQVKNDKIYLFL